MKEIAATAAVILVVANAVKLLFWSGPFPPDVGWSKRQLDRMERGKSPWTWVCWLTHGVERRREISRRKEER